MLVKVWGQLFGNFFHFIWSRIKLSALTCPSHLMDCYYLFLFICLLIWEKVSDSLELCSRGWSQILDSPDPPGTGITDVCQHTWIRVKFTEPFFVCLEENEPRCFCFCFVVCSFLYLKFSLTSLACEICKPHTTAVNHFIGFSPGQFCPSWHQPY